jgi:hypothetical protein
MLLLQSRHQTSPLFLFGIDTAFDLGATRDPAVVILASKRGFGPFGPGCASPMTSPRCADVSATNNQILAVKA